MARGFLSGALWGAIVGGVVLATVSVATGPVMAPQPQPDLDQPSATAPAAPTADAPPSTTPQAPARPGSTPETASPGLPDEPSLAGQPGLDTASAPMPEADAVAAAPGGGIAPGQTDTNAALPDADSPVLPAPQAMQPRAPGTEELSISTAPAQPPAPPVAEEPAPEVVSEPVPDVSEDASEEVAASDTPETDTTAAPTEDTASADVTQSDPAPEIGGTDTDEEVPPGVEDDPAPEGGAEEGGAAVAAVEDAPQAPSLPQVTPEDSAIAAPSAPETAPRVGGGASDLAQLAPDIATNRLPSAGAATDTEGSEAALPPDEAPLTAFAAQPARAPDQPLMSIVLIDDGSTPLGLEALEAFPYPLTFAVDTAWEGAGAAMARYRAAGFEVMALVDVPVAATPSDVEVSLRAALDVVPEAVAVLEGPEAGLQGSRALSDQVAQVLAETGHGLVLYPQGLNTAVSLAQRAGVPTQALFRDFDGEGQSATVIRRFLDQAAFKAGQEGAVIMVGRLRADTISALLIWGLQDRATRVSLVPVSLVLTRDEDA